jgi:hypothetical protein
VLVRVEPNFRYVVKLNATFDDDDPADIQVTGLKNIKPRTSMLDDSDQFAVPYEHVLHYPPRPSNQDGLHHPRGLHIPSRRLRV